MFSVMPPKPCLAFRNPKDSQYRVVWAFHQGFEKRSLLQKSVPNLWVIQELHFAITRIIFFAIRSFAGMVETDLHPRDCSSIACRRFSPFRCGSKSRFHQQSTSKRPYPCWSPSKVRYSLTGFLVGKFCAIFELHTKPLLKSDKIICCYIQFCSVGIKI